MQTTRRGLLTMGALSALGWATRPRTALGAVSVTAHPNNSKKGTLVSIFLRGGADGLNIVVPHGDDDYYRYRPTLGVARPNDRRAAEGNRVVDLNGFFGLNPALRALLPLYQSGQMAIVHACGSGDQTRSHFEAMATVERGAFRQDGPASGWLARHLESAPWDNTSPLRAIALGAIVPETLRGASNTTALQSINDLKLKAPDGARGELLHQSLSDLYGTGSPDLLKDAGREALAVLHKLQGLDPDKDQPANGAVYPKDDLGNGLRQVAALVKRNVGLEAACLDHGSYDTHVAQSALLTGLLHSLAASLTAFAADLGAEQWAKTTVLVLSEFGRRAEENSGAGTDHGRANAMFVLGGAGIAGGQVHGVWPTLAPEQLEGPGDLRVTTDYRDVLAEVLQKRLGNPRVDAIFPGLTPHAPGVTRV